jgi:hypothetical protein
MGQAKANEPRFEFVEIRAKIKFGEKSSNPPSIAVQLLVQCIDDFLLPARQCGIDSGDFGCIIVSDKYSYQLLSRGAT